MAEVDGFCDERFQPLADSFGANLDSGLDKGASLAVTVNGEPVVDLWGGTSDYAQSVAWETGTVVRVFSTSKVMVIICILMLVDRGLLDLDEPIASYWPEFARHGKGAITPRHVLVHQSGLPGFGRPVTFAELSTWTDVIALLEAAALWYEPGTQSCYHPMTYGFLLGELVRRVDGASFEAFFRREVTDPIGADFAFAVTAQADVARLAALWPPDSTGTDAGVLPDIDIVTADGMGDRAMGEITVADAFDPRFLHTVAPSGSGITNARALARIGSIVAARGVVDGRRFLSEAIIEQAGAEQSFQKDLVLGVVRYGIGFGLDSKYYPAPTPTTLHWGGFGGSFLTMDPATGISCGFAPSQLHFDGESRADPRRPTFWRLLGEISDQHFG
jgi:CubicO group peptidase (beta-lactamase class C family)